jgi:hypothetical protein
MTSTPPAADNGNAPLSATNAQQQLDWLRQVALADQRSKMRITREELLYIIANHDSAEAMMDAVVASFAGQPF